MVLHLWAFVFYSLVSLIAPLLSWPWQDTGIASRTLSKFNSLSLHTFFHPVLHLKL